MRYGIDTIDLNKKYCQIYSHSYYSAIFLCLFIKRMMWLTIKESAGKVTPYEIAHCQTKTADTEHILPNPILHDISPPSSWEL